jgi:hypothetical protein
MYEVWRSKRPVETEDQRKTLDIYRYFMIRWTIDGTEHRGGRDSQAESSTKMAGSAQGQGTVRLLRGEPAFDE